MICTDYGFECDCVIEVDSQDSLIAQFSLNGTGKGDSESGGVMGIRGNYFYGKETFSRVDLNWKVAGEFNFEISAKNDCGEETKPQKFSCIGSK